jgi:hypothetical protein
MIAAYGGRLVSLRLIAGLASASPWSPLREGVPMGVVSAAASSAVADLVAGPLVDMEVVAALPDAIYLAVQPGTGRAIPLTPAGQPPGLCLGGPRAVRVPSALVLPRAVRMPLGATGKVGAGRVELPGLTVAVTRWWRTPSPALDQAAVARAQRASLRPPALDGTTQQLVDELTAALAPQALDNAVRAPVTRLLGLGPGLTPLGDDILAGTLVTLSALGAMGALKQLGRAVLAGAPRATTLVSSALLWHAARGECVPQLEAFLTALGNGSPATATETRAALLRVGHLSGAGLLHGVAAALRACRTSRDLRRTAS